MISMSWRRDQVWPFFSTVTLGGRWRPPSTGPACRLGLAGWRAGGLSELADEKGWFLCRAATFFPAHAKKTDKIESSEKSHHDNWMGSRPDQDGMFTVQSGRWKGVGWMGNGHPIFGKINAWLRGRSQITLTSFCLFLTTYLPTYVDIFYLINFDKKVTFFTTYQPTSSCQRCLWTAPNHLLQLVQIHM